MQQDNIERFGIDYKKDGTAEVRFTVEDPVLMQRFVAAATKGAYSPGAVLEFQLENAEGVVRSLTEE
ncbi:hypothetical protein [Salinigranum halophilum]|uniref:hypothetical protein n=1 Tax=Salinigranum halophilum TaxID=2565931 RepID=UPI0010A80172|nr:hypothetical protein [Salinigranum halophilum]